jgi:hypothetical protein
METSPPVYVVKDDHGEILEGIFYAEELQKVIKTDDVYKIETILKKRKKVTNSSVFGQVAWIVALDLQEQTYRSS